MAVRVVVAGWGACGGAGQGVGARVRAPARVSPRASYGLARARLGSQFAWGTRVIARGPSRGGGARVSQPAGPREASRASATSGTSATALAEVAESYAKLIAPLAVLVVVDRQLVSIFVRAGIKFPSALAGMAVIFTGLCALAAADQAKADRLVAFFRPALEFIERWLSLFYVPSLVMLPLAGLPSVFETSKILILLFVGFFLSVGVTGKAVLVARSVMGTEYAPSEIPEARPPPGMGHIKAWGGVTVAALALFVVVGGAQLPAARGSVAMLTSSLFLLGSTVLGYLGGLRLPADVRKVLHPILVTTLAALAGCGMLATFAGAPFYGVLGSYKMGVAFTGAGDVLMGMLGSVILSFAFQMYARRALIVRHAGEMLGACLASALFGMFSTAALGRLLGLAPSLVLAIVPRSITVALALPIGDMLGASAYAAITASSVVLTGLVGANFVVQAVDAFGFKDPIARGIACASASHGLGTAALVSKERDALPYCAIAYGLTGILAATLASMPPIQGALAVVAGAAERALIQ